MKLNVYLFDERAAVLEGGRDQFADATVRLFPAVRDLSLAWRGGTPTPAQMRLWLTNLLPENGNLDPFAERASLRLLEAGHEATLFGPVEMLWGNAETDYSGAVAFSRDDETPPPSVVRHSEIGDARIAAALRDADLAAARKSRGRPSPPMGRPTSLSGVRGKIGLTDLDGFGKPGAVPSRWGFAEHGALNTWIAKYEHSAQWPGQAGLEAVCQRALRIAGIPAARTLSREFGDAQAVLSERSDRYWDRATGSIRKRHFEEFASAVGWPGHMKFAGRAHREPHCDAAFPLLPPAERKNLLEALAASVALAHNDLHRRNFAFLRDAEGGATLAPMYDVASVMGVPREGPVHMALDIAGQSTIADIGPRTWLAFARLGGIDEPDALRTVADALGAMPDAIGEAARAARNEDENIEQRAVDQRVEETRRHAAQRDRQWRDLIASARRKNAKWLRGIEAPSRDNSLDP